MITMVDAIMGAARMRNVIDQMERLLARDADLELHHEAESVLRHAEAVLKECEARLGSK